VYFDDPRAFRDELLYADREFATLVTVAGGKICVPSTWITAAVEELE
jgi:hypothetical protein